MPRAIEIQPLFSDLFDIHNHSLDLDSNPSSFFPPKTTQIHTISTYPFCTPSFFLFTVIRMLPGHVMPWPRLAWLGMACQALGQSRTSLVNTLTKDQSSFSPILAASFQASTQQTGTRGYSRESDTLVAFVLLRLNVLCFFPVPFSFLFLAMFFQLTPRPSRRKGSKTGFLTQFFDNYCDFHSSWDKKAEWQYRKGGLAFAKALIGKRKRVWGVGESTYWGAKTRCELRKRFLEKSAKRTNAKRKTQKREKTKTPINLKV